MLAKGHSYLKKPAGQSCKFVKLCMPLCCHRGVTRGVEGMTDSPALFQKLEKSALISGENVLIAVIYELNFLFKVQFLRVSRKKNRDFTLRGLSFSYCRLFFYRSALIPKKLPCPKKFLVTHLYHQALKA